jgi:hypothetical protein
MEGKQKQGKWKLDRGKGEVGKGKGEKRTEIKWGKRG